MVFLWFSNGKFALMDCSISVSCSYMVATRQLHTGHEKNLLVILPDWPHIFSPCLGVSGGALCGDEENYRKTIGKWRFSEDLWWFNGI